MKAKKFRKIENMKDFMYFINDYGIRQKAEKFVIDNVLKISDIIDFYNTIGWEDLVDRYTRVFIENVINCVNMKVINKNLKLVYKNGSFRMIKKYNDFTF